MTLSATPGGHPTAAVAAPSPDMLLVPAWWDFDGDEAPARALRAAQLLVSAKRGVAFVVRRHAKGAHVLSPQLIAWDEYLKRARRWGADVKAAEIAVERGQPFLRISPRDYDDAPAVVVVSKGGPYMMRVETLDVAQIAAVGTYLSALSSTTLIATYRQETEGRR